MVTSFINLHVTVRMQKRFCKAAEPPPCPELLKDDSRPALFTMGNIGFYLSSPPGHAVSICADDISVKDFSFDKMLRHCLFFNPERARLPLWKGASRAYTWVNSSPMLAHKLYRGGEGRGGGGAEARVVLE